MPIDTAPPPSPNSAIVLTVTMTDAFGDGWTGNLIAIRQNGLIAGTFGSTFSSGTSSGPVYITVAGDIEA